MVSLKLLSADLSNRIEAAYQERNKQLGWRLLYSPSSTLLNAEVVFLGANPGGNIHPADHAEFSMPKGSAYEQERWAGYGPGGSPLQRQVRALFQRLSVRADEVLAGNLVV